MNQSALPLTGSQTVGPFFAECLLREGALRQVIAQPETSGEHIRIEGRVLDGDGAIVPDALVEIWQANAQGRYYHTTDSGSATLDATFMGYGRSPIGEEGYYWFETIKPGPVAFEAVGEKMQAPHICVTIFARGLLNHLVTRLYFEDEVSNATDPVLLKVPEERRSTLLARRIAQADKPIYRLDIILQGPGETAFFNL